MNPEKSGCRRCMSAVPGRRAARTRGHPPLHPITMAADRRIAGMSPHASWSRPRRHQRALVAAAKRVALTMAGLSLPPVPRQASPGLSRLHSPASFERNICDPAARLQSRATGVIHPGASAADDATQCARCRWARTKPHRMGARRTAAKSSQAARWCRPPCLGKNATGWSTVVRREGEIISRGLPRGSYRIVVAHLTETLCKWQSRSPSARDDLVARYTVTVDQPKLLSEFCCPSPPTTTSVVGYSVSGRSSRSCWLSSETSAPTAPSANSADRVRVICSSFSKAGDCRNRGQESVFINKYM